MTAPGSPQKELEVLLAGLVEGVLPAAQKTRLGELLKDDAEARLFYKRYLEVHAMLDWESGTVAMQQSDDDTLQDLLRMEQAAYAQIVEMPKPLRLRVAKDRTPWEFGGALRYLISQPATWTAAAAVLALALILGIVFSGGEQPDNEIAQQPDITDSIEPGPVGPALSTAVATLTAEHDAQWAERASAHGSLTPGSKLHPGTRLTLTAGFAEITTEEGAVAILEAPCTVQLIDNNNAIRLHAGKLVGICETESSKGFLVRTAALDITDLGTRFGVVASKSGATEVHVFEGKVQAERVDTAPGTEPILLAANQSARTSADTDVIARIDHDTDRFAALLPTTIELPGTGHGLAVGDTDPNWQIVEVDGQALATPLVPSVYEQSVAHQIFDPDPSTSQWIGLDTTGQTGNERGNKAYIFQTQILIPESFDVENTELLVRFHADNGLATLWVNGRSVVVPNNDLGDQRDNLHAVRIDAYLVSGKNSLRFEVGDGQRSVQEAGPNPINFVGLLVAWDVIQPADLLSE